MTVHPQPVRYSSEAFVISILDTHRHRAVGDSWKPQVTEYEQGSMRYQYSTSVSFMRRGLTILYVYFLVCLAQGHCCFLRMDLASHFNKFLQQNTPRNTCEQRKAYRGYEWETLGRVHHTQEMDRISSRARSIRVYESIHGAPVMRYPLNFQRKRSGLHRSS